MARKIMVMIACLLTVLSAVVPLTQAVGFNAKMQASNTWGSTNTPLSNTRDGWELQWSHAFGGNGHAEFAQPIGDINQDGINEVIMGGYENSGICRIYQYNTTQQTYVQIYSWSVQGGSYHSPSGACVVDLDEDGQLEFCVSWGYSSYDGVYAYKWDGSAPVQLDWYHGTGMDFVYDVYACDYDNDGHPEVLIANDPNPGGKHVTALGWDKDTNTFTYETSWTCATGSGYSVPMVWSGDIDNDGLTEVIADVSDLNYATAGTWALNWVAANQTWVGVPVYTNYPSGVTVFGDGIGDVNNDGTPEIGVGTYGGTPQGFLFEWDGSSYQQVWNGQYPGQDPVIESVAVGDADNDGNIEFCFGTGNVHVIGWNGNAYYEKATLTGPTNMLAGLNIGDCDSDGFNEIKGCEILGGTGSEFIWKYVNPDATPPVTTCTLAGEMDGTVYISDVTVSLNATDAESGVDHSMYNLDDTTWTRYTTPFDVSSNGTHTVQYYSIDRAGNVETTKNATFVIDHHEIYKITIKGGIGLSMTMNNTGLSTRYDVPWSIALSGGHILVGKQGKSGTLLQLNPGAEVTQKLTVFGFGKITITATVDDMTQNATAWLFLFFVFGIK
jgi:hypothetical protein